MRNLQKPWENLACKLTGGGSGRKAGGRKLLSLLLSLVMVIGMLPVTAFEVRADEPKTIYYRYPVYKTDGDPKSGIKEWKTGTVGGTTGTACTQVKADTSSLTGGYYVVDCAVTRSGTMTVTGNVHLILLDGCQLTVSTPPMDNSNAGIFVSGKDNSLTIYAGTGNESQTISETGKLTVIAAEQGAGIGGSSTAKAGSNITINGGTVTATSTGSGAGIGGGRGGAGSGITINGGTVTATSTSSGAGIGGGDTGEGSDITINSGTVTAKGAGGGAGIGGGNKNSGSYITINGGTVTAKGAGGGAGIGGGNKGNGSADGSDITINGGTVTATGGVDGAAGIGGGWSGSGSKITITGGTVTATGGNGGAGIGNGEGCSTAASNIKAAASVVVKADTSANPTTVIAHDNDTDLSTLDDFKGKQYATAEPAPNYLTFTAQQAGSKVQLKVNSADKLYYATKTGGGDWSDWTDVTTAKDTGEIELVSVGDQIRFKGKNVVTGDADGENHFSMSGKISSSGSVTSLTDENGADPNVTLIPYCYVAMFKDCKSLVTAPELPAVTMAENCYARMFKGCTGLTTAPELPATDMKKQCYNQMFYGCTGLTAAPELKATTLAEGCYQYMFYSCVSLMLSTDQEKGTVWKIPDGATSADNWNNLMFANTLSEGVAPQIGTSYYQQPTDWTKAWNQFQAKSRVDTFAKAGIDENIAKAIADAKVTADDKANTWVAYATGSAATTYETLYYNSVSTETVKWVKFSEAKTEAQLQEQAGTEGKSVYVIGTVQNTPAADDFTYTAPTELTYDGNAKTATVAVKSGITGMGEITVKYYAVTQGSETPVTQATNAGDYVVKIDVAAGTSYLAATDITGAAGSEWKFTIAKADQAAPTAPAGVAPSAAGKSDGKITGVDKTMEYSATGSDPWTAVGESQTEITGLAAGDKISVRLKETDNYKAGTAKEITIPAVGEYTITFDANGGTEVAAQTVKAGGKVTKPADPKKTSYNFTGWYKEAALETKWDFETDTVSADMVLYAGWEEKEIPEYDVFFNMGGHGTQVATQSVAEKGFVDRPEDPEEAHWRFVDWYKTDAFETVWNFLTDKVEKTTTLFAKWVKSDYIVTVIDEGREESYVEAGAAFKLPKNEKENFLYWQIDGIPYDNEESITVESDVTVEAVYGTKKKIGGKERIITDQTMDVIYDSSLPQDGYGKRILDDIRNTDAILVNRPEISSHVRSSALKKYLADGDADSLVFYMDIRLAAIEDYEDETAKDLKLTYSLTPMCYTMNGNVPSVAVQVANEDLSGSIGFRLSIPNNVSQKYAKIEHMNENGTVKDTQYQETCFNVDANGVKYQYVDVKSGSFSDFVLTFTDEKPADPVVPTSDDDAYEVTKPAKTGTWNDPVTDGTWAKGTDGKWTYRTNALFCSTWGYIYNPYAMTEDRKYGWFYFDGNGRLLTGWQQIGGKWYYLNPVSDGSLGICYLNTTTPDGYKVDENGAWIQ